MSVPVEVNVLCTLQNHQIQSDHSLSQLIYAFEQQRFSRLTDSHAITFEAVVFCDDIL